MGVRWIDSGSGGGFEIDDDRPGGTPAQVDREAETRSGSVGVASSRERTYD